MNARLAVLLGAALLAGACDEETIVTGGGSPGDPTNDRAQSETSLAVSEVYGGGANVIISYNDDTNQVPAYIEYTPTDRLVKQGASLMGWSLSSDGGRTWTYKGRVAPPPGTAVLWSDPAVTARTLNSGVKGIAFMTNLELPSATFPVGGIHGSVAAFLGGACIARSTDSGQTFGAVQCVRVGGRKYDGSAIALAGTGRVCAAYNDIVQKNIDVWCADGALNNFTYRGRPFGSSRIIDSHPRLWAMDDGTMYLTTWSNNQLLMTRSVSGNTWSPPRVVNFYSAASQPYVPLGGTDALRTAGQFAVAVGPAYLGGSNVVRVIYGANEPDGRTHLRGTECDVTLTTCIDIPQWTTGNWYGGGAAAGHQFNPKLAVWPGTGSQEPVWKVTYYTTQDAPGTSQLSAKEGNLVYNHIYNYYLFQPFDFVPLHAVCATLGGYWGDYDYMTFNRIDPSSGLAEFIVGGSDSQRGCDYQWTFDSRHQHVSVAFVK